MEAAGTEAVAVGRMQDTDSQHSTDFLVHKIRDTVEEANTRLQNVKDYGFFAPDYGQPHEGGYKINPRTNTPEQTYLTPTGERYNSKELASEAIAERNKEAHEPLPAQMDDAQIASVQKPADEAVAELWSDAERLSRQDRNKNADEVYGGNSWLNGGREMHLLNAGDYAHKNEVSRLKRFDLKRMADNAWQRVGKQMTETVYNHLRRQYPGASANQLLHSAEAAARKLSDNAVYKYAVARNTPKSALEFFGKTAADVNLLRSIGKGLAAGEAGTTGDNEAYEQAMSDYGKQHRIAQIGGTVAGMALDPVTYLSGGIGSVAGKAALNIGGRLLAKKAAANVGARLFGSTLAGRVASGAAAGAANFGTYEGVKEAENQFTHGGHVDAKTGENKGYSAGEILKSTGRGLLLGSTTGTFAPVLGNVADKLVKATSGTAGKVGIRAGELAVSTLAEGTVFSLPDWIEGNGDAMDVWTDNMAMMLGFKASHAVKSAPRVIAGLRPVDNPKTQQERNHNRMSFMERLDKQLDASPGDIAFTKDEREELRKQGYDELSELFARKTSDKNRDLLEKHPEFDGYETVERLVQDPTVSQSARAKAYYILTGRMLPMSTVTGSVVAKDDEGGITVQSVASDGEVVTSRRFTDEAAAKREQDKIERQAELNYVDVGEQYRESVANYKVLRAAIEAVAPGADFATVMHNYRAAKEGNKEVLSAYGDMFRDIDRFLSEHKDIADTERPAAIRANIKDQSGVDVDAAIKKRPETRTQEEKTAVEDYVKRLFSGAEDSKKDVPQLAYPPKGASGRTEEQTVSDADNIVNTGDNKIHPIKLKGALDAETRDGYITGGNIVIGADGKIDKAQSSPSIVVRYADTGEVAMISPEEVISTGEVTDPVADTRKEVYNYDDAFAVRGDNGNAVEGRVISGADEDGRVMVEFSEPVGGRRVKMLTPEEINGMLYKEETSESPVNAEEAMAEETEPPTAGQEESGESALERIPKDAQTGEPQYTQTDADTAWDALVEQCGGDADMAQGVADSMVKDMETALKKAEKSAPAHGVTVAEKIAAAKGHKAAVEKARTELEKWRAIAGETASRARAAEEAERRRKKERLDAAREELRRNGRYAKEDAALGDYTDFADYAMRTIATGKYRFLWGDRESGTQGLGAHLGFTGSRTERNKRIWLLSKDGFTPEEAAERMLADYSAAAGFDSVGDTGVDSMEALDVILDVLRRYTSPRAMMDDAKAAHAENGESAEERRQGEEYERGQFMEAYHMTPEEYYEYENEWLPRYMEEAAQVPQEVIDNINAEYAEKYSENGKDDYNGGEDGRGVPPVQGERLDKPGGDEGGGDTGGAAGAVGEGDAAGGFVPQGASGREVRAGEVPQPVGKGAFGDIYDQFRGDAKAAFDFLTKHRSGDLLGVFHRDDTGDIDLVWGDENSGLSHILTKHVGKGKDFGTEQAAFDKIESILKNGKLIQDGRLRYVVSEDGYRVAIRKDYDGVKKNWIVTAVDYNRSKEEKEITTNPTSASHGANGPELAAPNNSKGKVTEESADLQENGGKDAGGKAEMPLSEQIDAASAEVNTEPTEAQKEAGNYKKGHVQVGMFDITIEQPEGSIRRGTDAAGKQWESKMHNTYGYFRGTEGVDGDHIDVFLSNDIDVWNGRKVYVVDQYNPDGTFDEHKVMLGFNDMDEAKGDYLANYKKGWENGRRIVVSATNLEDFEKWIDSSHRKTKPFAEYAGVKKETVANTPAKEEAAAPTDNANNAAYTITPATYTNKKGKTSDVSLLTFNDKLTADQERAVKEFAKERLGEGRFAPARGWKDRESGGWMFRSEEDARKAAEMVGNEEAVADNQPMTAQELRDAVEPKKPTASKKTAAKKPANRVEVADVAEQKPSEPTKAEQPKQDGEKKLVITDEMKHDEDILRELLGIGDEELDGGIKFRDPDAMTSQQRRFVYNAGVNYSLGYIDQGFVKFPEFAKAMVSRLGYKIKPWLKSFYEGAKRIPGYDQTMFTPTE